MALLTDRKFIHFNRKSDFEALLNANTISDKLIVFLKDAQEIWTHGTYYNSVEQFLDETNKDSTNAISAAAVYKALTDDEKTIAAALNDLNDRIENLDIPSKVSDLTDDLSLATLEYVDDKLDDVLGVSAAGVEAFVNMTRDEDTATGILTEIANKAPKTNAVNGAPLSNTESYFYGTSTTAAATALKEVSIPSITSLKTGQIIVVKPTITSTVANSTIKLNNFTAYPMRYNNAAITTSTDSIVWAANIPSIWVFDGTYWVFLGHGLDSNTTYSAMTQAEATTGTATTARTISAKVLHDTIEGSVPIKSIALNGTALTPDANKAVNISITNEGLGNGYAIQTDNGQTQNITASLTGYVLTINGRVSVKFNHDATYTPTLNINGTGAKTIKLADGSSLYQDYDYIKGGDIATFVYDGTYYRLVNVQRPKEFDSFLVPDPIELTLTDDSSSGIKVCSFSRNGATVHLPFWSTDTVLYNGVVYSDPQWSDAGPNLETYVFSNTSTEGIIQYLTIYHQFDPTYMGMVDEKWFVVTDEIVKTISIGASVLSEFYEPSSLDNEDLELAAGDTYEEAFGKLEKSINDNEQITAAALTDIDSRINTLHLPQSLDDIPDGSTRKLSDYATTTLLATKQDALVSGTNIKTINNQSLLGSGNITIEGGSGGGGDTNVIETIKVNGTALTPDSNKAVDVTVPVTLIRTSAVIAGPADSNYLSDDTTTGSYAIINTGLNNTKTVGYLEVTPTYLYLTWLGISYSRYKSASDTSFSSAWEPIIQPGGTIQTNNNTITLHLIDPVTKEETTLNIPLDPILNPVYPGSLNTTATTAQATNSSESLAGNITLHKVAKTGSYNDLLNKPTIPAAPGTLNTTATTAQSTSSSEALSGNVTLHKVAKTGTYSDLIGAKTKLSEFTNDSGYIANNTFYNTITLRSTTTTLNSEDIILQTGANKIELNPTGLTYRDTKHFLFDDAVITTDIEGGVDAHWSTLSDSQLLSAAVIKAKLDELPTVNNATLTIQKNGTTVSTFTANASSDVTANIQVNELPTVSSSDNGKILQVVNGAWALVTPTAIYSGTSAPDNTLGNNGDLYLQTS